MTKNEMLEVVEKAIAGDGQALAALCEEKGKQILYTAAGMMGNMHDGEEVMQEVLIKVFQNIGKLREPKYFDSWLYRIVLNECNSQRKKRMPRSRDIQISQEALQGIPEERDEFLPAEFAEDNEKRRMLLDVVNKLRPNYRAVVLLHYFDGLDYAQITRIMGISANMVANYLRNARKKIRTQLEKEAHTKFDNLLAAAPVPVISRAMRANADELISREKVNRIVSRAQGARPAPPAHTAKPAFPAAALKLIAGVAAAAVVAGIAVAPGARQTERPLSSSAAAASGVPQQPETGYAAEEGLEINESSSPMAGQGPQSGPAEGGETANGNEKQRVTGSLVLKGKGGSPVDGAEKYLAGIPVKLVDAAGNTVAETATDSEGEFDFADNMAAEGYTVRVETDDTQLLPAAENPKGIYRLGARDAAPVVLYVYKTFEPEAEILFLHGACDCGHANPKEARLSSSDNLDTAQNWWITDEKGGSVARGEGAVITGEMQALPEGRYTLHWEIDDIMGNTAVVKRYFRVVDGEVEPGMYD